MDKGVTLNGNYYTLERLPQFVDTARTITEKEFYQEVVLFIEDWFSSSKFVTVHTSGSTGVPKELQVAKQRMVQSAKMTCTYFNLQKGDEVLLCMPIQYIAGKMMLVRTLVTQLSLWVVEPQGRPLKQFIMPLAFAAMVPLQLYNSLQFCEDKRRLESIQNILVGGGAIDESIEKEIGRFPNAVYSSYGMTETVSHIAMRRLNGKQASAWYKPFPSVHLKQTEEGALIIEAPLVAEEILKTNDVVDLKPDGSFRVIGRLDNIINSGGVKIQAEKVEQKLRKLIHTPYVVTNVVDSRLGEAITLLIESTSYSIQELKERCKTALKPYEMPLHIFFVDAIPLTETKKVDRAQCKTVAMAQFRKNRNR